MIIVYLNKFPICRTFRMDSETGEENYIDSETGELLSPYQLNLETGEEETSYRSSWQHRVRRTFKIPSSTPTIAPVTPKVRNQKAPMQSGSVSPALMFLLPTAFFFNPFIAALLFVIEMSLHTWAHKKNRRLRDPTVFYQSPMHIIVSEFCAACLDEQTSNKINKIQEQRSRMKGCGIECVRQIVT